MLEVLYIIILILIFVFLGRYLALLITDKKSASNKFDTKRYGETPQSILQKSEKVEKNSRELAEAKLEEKNALKNALNEQEKIAEELPEAKLTQKANSEKDELIVDNAVSKSSQEIESMQIPSSDEVDKRVLETQKSSNLIDTTHNGHRDSLARIKGIGVKIEEQLNSIGCYRFDQIATWNEQDIELVNSKLAFSGRIRRDDWVGQAKLLAQGKETEFSKRVDSGLVASSKQK